jgi:hypothetical protein
MSGLRSIVSVTRCAPNRRATEAGTGSAKKIHTWPPCPERERPSAAGIPRRTSADEGGGIIPPSRLVESGGEKPACLVLQHGIDANGMTTAQMPINDFISHRQNARLGQSAQFTFGFPQT